MGGEKYEKLEPEIITFTDYCQPQDTASDDRPSIEIEIIDSDTVRSILNKLNTSPKHPKDDAIEDLYINNIKIEADKLDQPLSVAREAKETTETPLSFEYLTQSDKLKNEKLKAARKIAKDLWHNNKKTDKERTINWRHHSNLRKLNTLIINILKASTTTEEQTELLAKDKDFEGLATKLKEKNITAQSLDLETPAPDVFPPKARGDAEEEEEQKKRQQLAAQHRPKTNRGATGQTISAKGDFNELALLEALANKKITPLKKSIIADCHALDKDGNTIKNGTMTVGALKDNQDDLAKISHYEFTLRFENKECKLSYWKEDVIENGKKIHQKNDYDLSNVSDDESIDGAIAIIRVAQHEKIDISTLNKATKNTEYTDCGLDLKLSVQQRAYAFARAHGFTEQQIIHTLSDDELGKALELSGALKPVVPTPPGPTDITNVTLRPGARQTSK